MEQLLANIDNFSRKEFACRCCGQAKMKSHFLIRAQAFRYYCNQRFKKNVRIYCVLPGTEKGSGYRCPKHNKKIKGSPKSQHMAGQAMDIYSPDISTIDLFMAAKECGLFDTVIFYPNPSKDFVHCDHRGRESLSTWTQY